MSAAMQPMPWWCAPEGVALGFLLPVVFIIAMVGDLSAPALTIRGIRFLSPTYIALGAVLVLLIALGGWFGGRLGARGALPKNGAGWDRAAGVVGVIAMLAYLFWFRDYLLNPALMLRIVLGSFRPDRSDIELTPGLTSLANIAPVFFSIYAYRALLSRGAPFSRRIHVLCGVLVAFTAFRVYAWSERLALIEAVVPFGLAAGGRLMRNQGRLAGLLRALGPYLLLPGVIFYFGLAEYSRSWASDTYSGKTGFWEFALGRFASYYYTSLNNGAGMLATTDWPTFKFEFVLGWLHRAPLGVGPAFTRLTDMHSWVVPEFLARYADLEFNNPSGLYAVIVDLGLPLGMLYTLLIAGAAGMAFRAYRQGLLVGVLSYPVFFLTFLEIFRYPYLGSPRAFTYFAGIFIALLLAHTRAGTRNPEAN